MPVPFALSVVLVDSVVVVVAVFASSFVGVPWQTKIKFKKDLFLFIN